MIAFLIKSTLLLTLFYAFYLVFMRKMTFFRFNRAVLLVGTLACILMPLIKIGPHLQTMVSSLPNVIIPSADGPGADGSTQHFPWGTVAMIIYLAGVAFVLIASLSSMIFSYKEAGRPEGTAYHGCELHICDEDRASFSVFRRILISRDDFEHHPDILKHEMAHVLCHHSWYIAVSSIITAVYWFNPLTWAIRSEMILLNEFEADRIVLGHKKETVPYQLLMVEKSVGTKTFRLVNSFNRTSLGRRLDMIQTEPSHNAWRLIYIACLPLLLSAVLIFRGETLVVPDVNPLFKGKEASAFRDWTASHLNYPDSEKAAGHQGTVILSFTVNEKGKVGNVRVLRGLNETLDREAVRVVSKSPDWTAARRQGRPVSVTYTMPIIYKQ